MKIVIVGCLKSRKSLSPILEGLGYERNNDLSAAEKQFFDVGGYLMTAEEKVIQYDADVVICDAYLPFASFFDVASRLKRSYDGRLSKVKVIVMPGTAVPISYVEGEVKRHKLPFLADPADEDMVASLLEPLEREVKERKMKERELPVPRPRR